MARYKTLVDNPWSKKNEIVEDGQGFKWSWFVGYHAFPDGNGRTSKNFYLSDYPSIWQPIEEEEEPIKAPNDFYVMDPARKDVTEYVANCFESHADETNRKLNEIVDQVNSLTQRVKVLEALQGEKKESRESQ